MNKDKKLGAGCQTFLHSMVFLFILASVLFLTARVSLQKPLEAARRSSCQNNLKQFGVVFEMYTRQNSGKLPPLSSIPGRLMFTIEAIYPDYMNMEHADLLVCPNIATHDKLSLVSKESPELVFDDHSYYYLSHSTVNEDEGMSFVEAYRAAVFHGKALPDQITTADGVTIRRAMGRRDEELGEILPTVTPVMIEKPGLHNPNGGHVLYEDGHVEYLRMGDKYPMTESFIAALESIDM